jgi:two-component sensor histidine kinase
MWRATGIRGRLAIAMALALTPALILTGLEAALQFEHELRDRKALVSSAAQSGAGLARARLSATEILLESLAAAPVSPSCHEHLGQIRDRITYFANIVRLDAAGRAVCAATPSPDGEDGRGRRWFGSLAASGASSVTQLAEPAAGENSALIVAVPARNAQGGFEGAVMATVPLTRLGERLFVPVLPTHTVIGFVDGRGSLLGSTHRGAFPLVLTVRHADAVGVSPLWPGRGRDGEQRLFAVAPVIDGEVWAATSAPSPGFIAWAFANPIAAVVLPLLAFLLPLLAVVLMAERGVVAWIGYLRRVASIYAGGRYSVHPLRAQAGPPEIRALAEAIDAMAGTIAARDAQLTQTLADKDDLLREIHHRVKNNLQVISSLLTLQERVLTDTDARASLAATRHRIGALALIYRALYEGPDLRRVDLRPFLHALIAQTLSAEDAGAIRTDLKIDALIIDADRLAPLALFAVEAVTYACKHYPQSKLSIRLTVEGERAEFFIANDGDFADALPVADDGVGRTLMVAFARQLGGELLFPPHADAGQLIRLRFPTPVEGGARSASPGIREDGHSEASRLRANRRGLAQDGSDV